MTQVEPDPPMKMAEDVIKIGFNSPFKNAHYGGALSCVEILWFCAEHLLNFEPGDVYRDRLILSKGHACLALYSLLYRKGFITRDELESFEKPGSALLGHPVINREIGIDYSTGSLGMGLGLGIGAAMSFKIEAKRRPGPLRKVAVVLGDGELNEGSIWESLRVAGTLGLSNLFAFIDLNGWQQTGSTDQISKPIDLERAIDAFGWSVAKINGHEISEMRSAYETLRNKDKPTAFICQTIKGRGLGQFENTLESHHLTLPSKTYEELMNVL